MIRNFDTHNHSVVLKRSISQSMKPKVILIDDKVEKKNQRRSDIFGLNNRSNDSQNSLINNFDSYNYLVVPKRSISQNMTPKVTFIAEKVEGGESVGENQRRVHIFGLKNQFSDSQNGIKYLRSALKKLILKNY